MMIAIIIACAVLAVVCMVLASEVTQIADELHRTRAQLDYYTKALKAERTERIEEAEMIISKYDADLEHMTDRVNNFGRQVADIRRRYVLYREPTNCGVTWAKDYKVNEDE